MEPPSTAEPVISYIEPTPDAVAALLERGLEGPVVMLNLLRLRAQADYSRSPELAPEAPITGAEAYRRYAEHTAPFLAGVGGEVAFAGVGGEPVIGPTDERWDVVLLVRYPGVEAFLSMAQNEDYLAGTGHRTAALEDSRLLPLSTDAALVRAVVGG